VLRCLLPNSYWLTPTVQLRQSGAASGLPLWLARICSYDSPKLYPVAHLMARMTSPECSPDDYILSLNRHLGAEIAERRVALGLSAYTLARAANVSDQTVLNIERGQYANGCWTATLARMALRLGTTLSELIAAAERRA